MSDLARIVHEGELVGGQPAGFVRVLTLHNVFTLQRTETRVAEGLTLGDILRGLALPHWQSALVAIDGDVVPPKWWDLVRPKAGHIVTVRCIPRGGGDSGNKGWIQITAGVLTLQYGVGGYFITLGIAGRRKDQRGGAAQHEAVPKLKSGSGGDQPVYSITGSRNVANPYGPIPKVYGRGTSCFPKEPPDEPMDERHPARFFFNDTATTEIYTPIVPGGRFLVPTPWPCWRRRRRPGRRGTFLAVVGRASRC